jgi:hypothetical protein
MCQKKNNGNKNAPYCVKPIKNMPLRLLYLLVFVLMVQAPVLSQTKDKKKVPNLPAFDYRPLHFGFLIGLNSMDFRVYHKAPVDRPEGMENRYAELVNLNPGVNIGIVTSLRLNKNFNLRFLPGISFGQRDLWYIQDGEKDEGPLEIKSTFLEFPLLLKFSGSRMTNLKPYVVGGINPRIDLAKSENDGLNLYSTDLYLEVGAGLDMYLNYFRLSTEAKLSVGLRNVLDPSGTGEPEVVMYTDVLDRLTSRLFVFTFYFE